MRHKSKNKTRPLFTLSLEMTRLVNETRLLLVPCVNSDIYGTYSCVYTRVLTRSLPVANRVGGVHTGGESGLELSCKQGLCHLSFSLPSLFFTLLPS